MNIGWIDFSDNDRKKTMDVLRLFQEQGAVDELGIGIIRDGFANYFFPGTSCLIRPTSFAPFGRNREGICCHFKEK